MGFLPVNRDDMNARGWDSLDFLLISGDAYVDHPSFGTAVISRVLENAGFRVGIAAMPDWTNPGSISLMGRPRLGVLVTSGVIDSMVNNYTALKRKRREDRYSPGDAAGKRPDRAVIVYTGLAKQVFKGIPVIIGGVEAGLRRFAHYDYWSDSVRRSVLFDSKADILVFGPGEQAIVEIAGRLRVGASLAGIRGTAYISNEIPDGSIEAASYEETAADRRRFAEAFKTEYEEQDPYRGKPVYQRHGDRFLVSMPPPMPMTTEELDEVYSLPYERTYHPMYEKDGGIRALEEVRFSITSHRGCPGGC
ncbi:MAG: YgiQ family radical SAM protein, partial [Clostridia bacterium]